MGASVCDDVSETETKFWKGAGKGVTNAGSDLFNGISDFIYSFGPWDYMPGEHENQVKTARFATPTDTGEAAGYYLGYLGGDTTLGWMASKLAKGLKLVDEAIDATNTVRLADRAAEVRSVLGIGQRRTIAVAEYSIGGQAGELVGVSGRAARPGTVGVPFDPVFKPESVGGFVRDLDAEYKILEELASQLGPSSNVTGVVNMYSELTVCGSCSAVIGEFTSRYPNVVVNVLSP